MEYVRSTSSCHIAMTLGRAYAHGVPLSAHRPTSERLGNLLSISAEFLRPGCLEVPRWRMAMAYAAIRIARARGGEGPVRKDVIGYSVEAADVATLMYLFREVFVAQEYAFETAATRPRIIDAGANVGMATLYFKMICPGAVIDAYEPSPASFRILERNVASNALVDVRLHEAALAPEAGRIALFTERGEAASLRASTRPERGGAERTEVEAVTLSSQISEPVDLLKMDVEGLETEILNEVAGSGKMDLIREMMVEYHHNIGGDDGLSQFLALLESQGFGYRLRAAPHVLRSPVQSQDVFVWAYRASG